MTSVKDRPLFRDAFSPSPPSHTLSVSLSLHLSLSLSLSLSSDMHVIKGGGSPRGTVWLENILLFFPPVLWLSSLSVVTRLDFFCPFRLFDDSDCLTFIMS